MVTPALVGVGDFAESVFGSRALPYGRVLPLGASVDRRREAAVGEPRHLSMYVPKTEVCDSARRSGGYELGVVQQDKLSRGSLILYCNTRWNSTHLMLSTTFKNKAAFDRMVDEDKLYDSYFQEDENGKRSVGPPLSYDWENVCRLVQFLKIFYDATLDFSSYKNLTSSHCFNDICTIEANLSVFTSSRDVNMSNMAFEMKKTFDKYWEGFEINKLLIISSVFDPKSKMGFVTICFEKLYGKNTPKCIEMKEAVMEVLCKLYEVYNAFEMELLDVGVNVGDV
nr:zinc finger BED domain-containing protein RICESLEEPER 2-like [Ipomoea batatas]